MIVPNTLHELLFEAIAAAQNLPDGYELDMDVWIWREEIFGPASVSVAGAWLVSRRRHHRILTTDFFEEHLEFVKGDLAKENLEGHRMVIIDKMRQGRFLEAHAMMYGDWARNPLEKGVPIATPHVPTWDILMLASIVVRDTLVTETPEKSRAEWYSYERAARLLKEHGI